MRCPVCKHSNPDENRFCGNCGVSLVPATVERSEAQNTVDYLERVAREHPRGERPENPASPEGRYEIETPPPEKTARKNAEEQEREHARNVAEFRDSHANARDPQQPRYPREGYDDAEQPVVELEPELIDFDNRMPLIARPGMDRRRPEWRFHEKPLLDPSAAASLREKARQDAGVTQPAEEALQSAPKVNSSAREAENLPTEGASAPLPAQDTGSILGLGSPTPEEFDIMDKSVSSVPGETGTVRPIYEKLAAAEELRAVEPVRNEAAERNHFLDISETTQNDRTALHGPSFLGLDSTPITYEDDNDGGSHARRTLALVILLVLVGLGALQWRSIRDFGMRYAGTMHLPGRGEASGQAIPAVPQNAQATQPASDGKPEMVAEATQNPNAKSQSGTQSANTQNGAPQNGASNSGAQGAGASQPNGAKNNPTQPPSQGTDVASNRDSSRMPQDEPASAEDTTNEDANSERATASVTEKRNHAQPKEATRPDPGQAELAQAAGASAPEAAAVWLWRAVGKGSPEAQVRLADMYADGRGVPQNCEQAVILLKSASNKNFARARIRLGSMYATGKCVQQDRVAAYQWMSRALDSSPGSQWVEENRQMLWSQMSEEERRRASGKM